MRWRGRYFCLSLGLSGTMSGQLLVEGHDGEEKERDRYIEGSKTETKRHTFAG